MSVLTLPVTVDEMDPIVQTYIANHHLPLSAATTPRTSTSSTSSMLVDGQPARPFAARTPNTSPELSASAAFANFPSPPTSQVPMRRRHRRSHAISISPSSPSTLNIFGSHSAPATRAASHSSRISSDAFLHDLVSSGPSPLLESQRSTRIAFSDVPASPSEDASAPSNRPGRSALKSILRRNTASTASIDSLPAYHLAVHDDMDRPKMDDRHDSTASDVSLISDVSVEDDLFEELKTPQLDDDRPPRLDVLSENHGDSFILELVQYKSPKAADQWTFPPAHLA